MRGCLPNFIFYQSPNSSGWVAATVATGHLAPTHWPQPELLRQIFPTLVATWWTDGWTIGDNLWNARKTAAKRYSLGNLRLYKSKRIKVQWIKVMKSSRLQKEIWTHPNLSKNCCYMLLYLAQSQCKPSCKDFWLCSLCRWPPFWSPVSPWADPSTPSTSPMKTQLMCK